jgi:lysophospholipase L1-like esterase
MPRCWLSAISLVAACGGALPEEDDSALQADWEALSAAEELAGVTAVGLVGDSTVAAYPGNGALEKHGWSYRFAACLDASKAKAIDYAKGGRSTKSYRAEGLWNDVLRAKPGWVFVQFGHNDQGHAKPGDPVGTTPSQYHDYLTKYVEEAQRSGLHAILVTPPPRLKFSGGAPTTELAPYAAEVRKVARAANLPLVDLHALWGSRLRSGGERAMRTFYATDDTTHFNAKGAAEIANLVCVEARKQSPAFAALSK